MLITPKKVSSGMVRQSDNASHGPPRIFLCVFLVVAGDLQCRLLPRITRRPPYVMMSPDPSATLFSRKRSMIMNPSPRFSEPPVTGDAIPIR